MKSFEEATEGFGWTFGGDSRGTYPVVDIGPGGDVNVEVILEPQLYRQYLLKVFVNGVLVAEPVPVYPGGSAANREMWEAKDPEDEFGFR